MKFQVTRTSGRILPTDGCEPQTAMFRHKSGEPTRTIEWDEKEFASFEEVFAWMVELEQTEIVLSTDGGWEHWDRIEGPEPPEAEIEIYDDYRE